MNINYLPFEEGFLMREVELQRQIFSDKEIVGREKLRLYELGMTGVPFVTDGEKLVFLARGQDELAAVPDKYLFVLGNEAEKYRDFPVSNLTFKIVNTKEGVSYENVSYICDIKDSEIGHFEYLNQHGNVTLRLLRLDQELREESGLEWMVEIGFGEQGKGITLERILLPEGFDESQSVIKEGEVGWGRSDKKMAEAMVEVWDVLRIDRFENEWDERVRQYLKGNVRDINKAVEIWNKEGVDLITGWMVEGEVWGGLGVDKFWIDEFKAQQEGHANMKAGDIEINKFGHLDAGAVSSATAGERDEEQSDEKQTPKVIGDVKLKLADGRMVERAVEGTAEEIDGLINKLVSEMEEEYGLRRKKEAEDINQEIWLVGEEGGFNRFDERVSDYVPVEVETGRIEIEEEWQVGGAEVGKDRVEVEEAEAEVIETYSTDSVNDFANWWIVAEVESDEDGDDEDWIIDDGGEGGGSEGPDPGGLVRIADPVEVMVPREKIVFRRTGQVKSDDQSARVLVNSLSRDGVVSEGDRSGGDEVIRRGGAGIKNESQIEEDVVDVVDERLAMEAVDVGEEIMEEGVEVKDEREEGMNEVVPWWSWDLEAAELPWFNVADMVEVELRIPVGAVMENLDRGTKGAEIMFGNGPFFEYYADFISVVLALFNAMLNNKMEQVMVPVRLREEGFERRVMI